MFEIVASIEDYSILLMYLEQLSKTFATSRELLLKQFKTFLRTNRVGRTQAQQTQKKEEIPQRYLVSVATNKDFLTALSIHHAPVSDYANLVRQVATAISPSLLVESTAAEEDEQQKLNEAQLRREHHLESLSKDKQLQHISTYLKKQLHTLQRQLIKADLPHKQKQELLESIRTLK